MARGIVSDKGKIAEHDAKAGAEMILFTRMKAYLQEHQGSTDKAHKALTKAVYRDDIKTYLLDIRDKPGTDGKILELELGAFNDKGEAGCLQLTCDENLRVESVKIIDTKELSDDAQILFEVYEKQHVGMGKDSSEPEQIAGPKGP